jgi:GNAT superfamily N-acetyltransferase
MAKKTSDPTLTILPANKASWADLMAILGASRCHSKACHCQRFKIPESAFHIVSEEQRAERLLAQTQCDHPRARRTSGLVAYLGDEPVGWCNVEPRPEFPALISRKMPWVDRNEDPDDPSVWAVTCLIIRNGYRKRGYTYALARAAVDFARQRGARALEGYAMITEPGKTITWGELHVGALQVFADAGFKEVTHPSKRRFVMRIDF